MFEARSSSPLQFDGQPLLIHLKGQIGIPYRIGEISLTIFIVKVVFKLA